MNPVSCDSSPKLIINACVIFVVGLLVLVLPKFVQFFHHFDTTLDHWIGGTFITIALLGILTLKKVIIDGNGIRVEYYIGKTTQYHFQQIVDITAKMNMQPLSLYSRMAGLRRHQLILQPGGGKMKIILSSTGTTSFMEFFNALQQVYGPKVNVINHGN